MNNGYDTNSIPSIDNIRQVKISLGTDQGTFEIDMSNLQPGQVELEQRISQNYPPFLSGLTNMFDMSKQIELLLRCRPLEYTFTYHPPCDYREAEESDDCEELQQFLSSFERSDEDANETQ